MSNSTSSIGISLNIVTSILNLFSSIICLILFSLIIYRLITKRMGNIERASLYLTMNTLFALISTCLMLFVYVNLSTIRYDFNINSSFILETDSIECHLYGYIYFSLICSIYWSYALQAVFRFLRVVYSIHLRMNHLKIYLLIFIPLQWILAFIIVIPLATVLNGIYILLPHEIYCSVHFDKILSLIYASVAEVWIPVLIISICYFKIVRKIRQRSSILITDQRNKRDLKVIRRVIIMILILSIINLPTIIDLIIYWISSNQLDPLIYRITWLSLSIGCLILSIMIPKLITHIHILKDCRKLRIIPQA